MINKMLLRNLLFAKAKKDKKLFKNRKSRKKKSQIFKISEYKYLIKSLLSLNFDKILYSSHQS